MRELVAIRLAEGDIERCQIRITQGKGNKDRQVPFPASFQELLALHMDRMREKGATYLFESIRKHKNTDRGVRKMLARYATAVGIAHSMSPISGGISSSPGSRNKGSTTRSFNRILVTLVVSHWRSTRCLRLTTAQQAYDQVMGKFPFQLLEEGERNMEEMADQQQQPGGTFLVSAGAAPWWVRFCRWLWKHPLRFLWFTLIINVAINIGSTWFIAPATTNAIPDTSMFGRTAAWIGAHWLFSCLLLTISIALLLVTWLGSRWPTSTFSLHGQMSDRDRENVLRLLRSHYERMLSRSLQGGAKMELGLQERPAAIRNAASLSLRLPEQPEQTLPFHTSIVAMYNPAEPALLILGEPGAGKSTLLFDLAYQLAKQAESDGRRLLPILLSLSSWTTHRRPLQDWIIEQSVSLYDIPRQWIQADSVLPLLDGLDEMDVSDRSACIKAINTYRREHLRPLVVCSRTNEYEEASAHERLMLNNAVVVQPLSQEQVKAYLARQDKPLDALWRTLEENPTLATTPLMLQILISTYHGTTVGQGPCTEAAFLQQLWTEYVQRMVKLKGNTAHYPLDRTVTWLGWLAQQMRDRNQDIFYPGKIAYWLTKRQRLWYRWSIGLLVGLVCALLSGLIFGLVSGLIGGLITMLFIGLSGRMFGFDGKEFESIQNIKVQLEMPWSWRKTWKELGGMATLLIALLALVGGVELFSWMYPELMLPAEQFAEQVSQAASSLPAGLVSWMHSVLPIPSELLSCVCSSLISLLIVPFLFPDSESQSVVRVGDQSIGHTLLSLLLGLLFWSPITLFWYHWTAFDAFNIFAAILSLLLLTLRWLPLLLFFLLFFGRGPMILHYTLRFWLWRSGFIPRNWKPVSFLEYATACSLLRRVGGGYRFAHPLLREYFADLNTTIPSSPTSVHPVQQPLQP